MSPKRADRSVSTANVSRRGEGSGRCSSFVKSLLEGGFFIRFTEGVKDGPTSFSRLSGNGQLSTSVPLLPGVRAQLAFFGLSSQ